MAKFIIVDGVGYNAIYLIKQVTKYKAVKEIKRLSAKTNKEALQVYNHLKKLV